MTPFDRYELYELCVQSPPELVELLRAIHGGRPRILGEDFCGTAALSAEWVRRVEGGRAIAVDHDDEPLGRAGLGDAIEIVHGDVVRDTSADRHHVEVIYAGNFSIGEWHDRPALLAYLGHVHRRLDAGGIFACDIYGGESAYAMGSTRRDHPAPGGRTVRHVWEQREADPMTGRVVNALHFQVLRDGEVEQELRDAFVYHWRLWGVPELRDAMVEAGFTTTDVYRRVPDAVDGDGAAYAFPVGDPSELDESFDVLVVARTA